jgi:hypothetical protein
MRTILCSIAIVLTAASLTASKKVVSPETSAGNELVDIMATISLSQEEVTQKLGADAGKGIVLLKVKITPKTDKSVQVSPDDFVLLAHDDGERNKPYEPEQIAADGALIVKNTAQNTKKGGPSFSAMGMVAEGHRREIPSLLFWVQRWIRRHRATRHCWKL